MTMTDDATRSVAGADIEGMDLVAVQADSPRPG